jgi:RHS repeat-associated protein
VNDVWENDPHGKPRPARITSTGVQGGLDWDSRPYGYDGAGNVVKEGAAYFLVDPVSRVVSSHVLTNRLGTFNGANQSYTYDGFGNILSITTKPVGTTTETTRLTPTSAATNRLTGAGTTYDGRGNLTSWNGAAYRWGALDKMWRMTSGAEDWVYVYTADDERLFGFQIAGSGQVNRFTLRDLGGQVLREYIQDRAQGYAWHVERDYVYRDGALLAAETPEGTRHFHLDHLGSPRLVTDGAGNKKGFHAYLPFGEEASVATQDAERMKFTGHERDLAATTGANPTADDLDYMHARFYSPLTGRFLSVDAHPGIPNRPQSWNRYAYAYSDPLVIVDPDGNVGVRCDACGAPFDDPSMALAALGKRISKDTPEQRALGLALTAPAALMIAGGTAAMAPEAFAAVLPRVTGALLSPEIQAGFTVVAAGLAGQNVPTGQFASIVEGTAPFTSGQVAQFERQLASGGVGSLLKSRATFVQRLAEHLSAIEEYSKEGGFTSSLEREIRSFAQQINAIDEVLKSRIGFVFIEGTLYRIEPGPE